MRGLLPILIVLGVLAMAIVPLTSVPNTLAQQYEPALASLDKYGGYKGLTSSKGATGFFEVEQISAAGQTHWWFINPEGNAYYSNGVTLVTPKGLVDRNGGNPYQTVMKSKYGDPLNLAAWASDVDDRLRSWGYNALGGYSSSALYNRFPHTVELTHINAAVYSDRASNGGKDDYPILYELSEWDSQYRRYFFDVFHPTFQSVATSHIVSTITSNGYAGDPYLVGYFVDNEVPFWYGRDRYNPNSPWYTDNTLADVFIALPRDAPGKQEWVNLLEGTYANTISSLNAAWGSSYSSFDSLRDVTSVPNNGLYPRIAADKSEFLRLIVGTYFKTVRDAIRSVDASHLYLGSRFVTGDAARTPTEVYAEAGKYMDVMSVNHYVWVNKDYELMKIDLDTRFNEIWTNSRWGAPNPSAGRPILVTEFSFSARDSGMCTDPATCVPNGAVVDTQEQRAQLYADFQRVSVESPYVVGHHWWSYFDPPRAGNSWGGENSNMGLVDNDDKPYLRMLYRMYQESPNIYGYRGLVAPSRSILTSASGSTSHSGDTSVMSSPSSIEMFESGVRPLAGSPSSFYRVFLPLVAKSYIVGLQTNFNLSLASAVDSVTIDIYQNSGASAAFRRRWTVATPLAAGTYSLAWDGLDQSGIQVGTGSFYFVVKVTTASGEKEYAVGTFTR